MNFAKNAEYLPAIELPVIDFDLGLAPTPTWSSFNYKAPMCVHRLIAE